MWIFAHTHIWAVLCPRETPGDGFPHTARPRLPRRRLAPPAAVARRALYLRLCLRSLHSVRGGGHFARLNVCPSRRQRCLLRDMLVLEGRTRS